MSLTFSESTATFSPCKAFRYTLTRRWSDGPTIAVIGLNPSTADEFKLDPTITRCVRRADTLGFGRLVMLNLFAFRSTDPKALYKRLRAGQEIVGPENNEAIGREARAARMVLCCWGSHGELDGRSLAVFTGPLHGLQLHCLGTTVGGQPRHPLYLSYDQQPEPWGGRN